MADIAQVLATGGTTIVGVTVGAGLTYWHGALNRHHQEAREDKTRWYEARLQAYTEFYLVTYEGWHVATGGKRSDEQREELGNRLVRSLGVILFVGSESVSDAAVAINDVTKDEVARGKEYDEDRLELSWTHS